MKENFEVALVDFVVLLCMTSKFMAMSIFYLYYFTINRTAKVSLYS